ncbi:hypothetical protein ACN28I_38415 [Archangium gephyra]
MSFSDLARAPGPTRKIRQQQPLLAPALFPPSLSRRRTTRLRGMPHES